MTHPAARSRKSIFHLLCFAVLVVFAAALAAQAPKLSPWNFYSYPADGFSALFPAQPELSQRHILTDAGTFEVRYYSVEDGRFTMIVAVCDFGSALNGKDPDATLRGAENGALRNSNSHLLNERKIALGVYPGIEMQAESGAARFTARIYLVGSTLYQIIVVAPDALPDPDAGRFLDSFQQIPRASAP